MFKIRFFSLLILLTLTVSTAYAGRNITLPFEEKFDSGDTWTNDLVWVQCGAQARHYNSGGLTGGYADFMPPSTACASPSPNANGGMSTFGRLEGFSAPQLNFRFLMKVGSSYAEDLADGGGGKENKLIDVHGNSGHRFGVLSLNWTNQNGTYLALGTWADGNVVTYTNSGRGWIEDAEFKIDLNGNNQYTDEWICIEYEIRPANNTQTIYVWTSDNAFSGPTVIATKTQSGNMNYADLGGYFNAYVPTIRDSNHLKFDEIKLDTRFIGPPAGFSDYAGGGGGGTTTVQNVSGLRIVTDPSTTPDDPPPSGGTPDLSSAIFVSDFEEGNFSEWQGGNTGGLNITTDNVQEGNYCARADLIEGHHGDVGYGDYYFGDHVAAGDAKVTEAYLTLWSKFSSGYVWPSSDHKIAILNLTDSSGARQYQVYIYVNSQGQYVVDHSDIGDWQWTGYGQNIGTPVTVRGDSWDKLKLHVRLNTPGASDGALRFWVNDQLKGSYSNINLRENTNFGLNKLILSTWADASSGSNGTQFWDNIILSTQDPDQ